MLAEVWSKTVIDKHEVVAEYIPPEYNEKQLIHKDWKWSKKHVRESQYMLQIVKCDDRGCCSIPRSSYFNLVLNVACANFADFYSRDLNVTIFLQSRN